MIQTSSLPETSLCRPGAGCNARKRAPSAASGEGGMAASALRLVDTVIDRFEAERPRAAALSRAAIVASFNRHSVVTVADLGRVLCGGSEEEAFEEALQQACIPQTFMAALTKAYLQNLYKAPLPMRQRQPPPMPAPPLSSPPRSAIAVEDWMQSSTKLFISHARWAADQPPFKSYAHQNTFSPAAAAAPAPSAPSPHTSAFTEARQVRAEQSDKSSLRNVSGQQSASGKRNLIRSSAGGSGSVGGVNGVNGVNGRTSPEMLVIHTFERDTESLPSSRSTISRRRSARSRGLELRASRRALNEYEWHWHYQSRRQRQLEQQQQQQQQLTMTAQQDAAEQQTTHRWPLGSPPLPQHQVCAPSIGDGSHPLVHADGAGSTIAQTAARHREQWMTHVGLGGGFQIVMATDTRQKSRFDHLWQRRQPKFVTL